MNWHHENARSARLLKTLALALAVSTSAAANAVTPAGWSVAVGVNNIAPKGKIGPFSAPSVVDSYNQSGSDTQPIVNIAYRFSEHLSAELGLGTPYTHQISGAGALQGSGKLGSLQQLPPTLFGQYHFRGEASAFRPYVGMGITHAIFRNERGSGTLTAITNPGGPATTFTVDNAWGLTPQIGATYAFDHHWFADVMLSKTYLHTTVHLSTGQSAYAPLNPVSTAVSVGYRF
ncbi:MAG TPA: OmpW family outer membrane protein [Rhodocyclaceae bacterium]|nr:OmpW family outer membrane protein [Rhodocyclaceae bacterium]